MTDRCAFTELPVDQCAHCLGHNAPPPPQLPSGWLRARYPGSCALCGELFEAGAPIAWSDSDPSAPSGNGGWIAECCADAREAG